MMPATYACNPLHTRGRRFPQAPAPTRDDYQRDRDRIVHSSAFRRLVYKTQVFLNHEGDLFRTRLTHSLEVAQLGRSIARSLNLNEDLVETIALAHDLGHTPFGHAGQDALNACMFEYGGFEHNLQSLRVVDHLEERYPEFDGLNLTFETREGVLKHCSRANALALEAQEPNGVASRFLRNAQPSLEAQLCNLADEIAYNAHDIDDGVRSGLITLDQLQEVPLFDNFRQQTLVDFPNLQDDSSGRRLLYESLRRMLSQQVYDVIAATSAAIAAAGPDHVDAVRQLPALVQFSDDMRRQSNALKTFLLQQLYRHPQVIHSTDQGRRVVRSLFQAYMAQPFEMPERYRQRAARSGGGGDDLPRTVADYIAGMTDRFALHEHTRLTGEVLLNERI
jgi:dGTPase